VDIIPLSGVEADSMVLAKEQEQNPTLATCWSQAQAGKGGFLVHRGPLYPQAQVEGHAVCQLCVCPSVSNRGQHLVVHVNGCAVSDGCDVCGAHVNGELTPTSVVVSGLLFSSRVTGDQSNHLALDQRQDRLQLLDECAGWSRDNSRKCDAVGHHVQTSIDVVPCLTRPRRIPDAVESEVSLQTRDLFDLGLTRRSAIPMVGITDTDIDVHLPCDYRSRERCKFSG